MHRIIAPRITAHWISSNRISAPLLPVLFLLLAVPALSAADDPFLLGEYTVTRVIDGDTIAVEGLEKTIRFLCIDTEECEKGPGAEARTSRIALDYAAWVAEKTADDRMAKFSTPLGWKAKEFAEAWFPVGSTVRVVLDSLSRRTGHYDRVLAYVLARRGDAWVNYNVECVRAGMSPYFNKYGCSIRFEAAFLAAEREARIHRRGIWGAFALCYPDYDARCAWWNRRSAAIDLFRAAHGDEESAVEIMDETDWLRLGDMIGREVLLFGTFRLRDDGEEGMLVELAHKQYDVAAVLFDGEEAAGKVRSFLDRYSDTFVCFRGTLAPGFKRGRRSYEYSLTVADAAQVFIELPAEQDRPGADKKKVGRLGADTVPWEEAPQYAGSAINVAGTIVATKNIGSCTFLNFHRDYRNTLTIVIREESYGRFPEPAEATYLNRTIRVRGTVSEHEGAPQIVITGPDEIEILE